MWTVLNMRTFLFKEILSPLTRRAGTAFGALLLAQGVDGETVAQIVTGLTALLAVAVDLGLSYLNRKAN